MWNNNDNNKKYRHGINKSIARRAYQFKQAAGLTKKNAATQDALFDALYERFEYQRVQGRRFVQDILDWAEQIKNHCAMIECFASTLNYFYDGSSSWGPISSFSQVSFGCIAQEMVNKNMKNNNIIYLSIIITGVTGWFLNNNNSYINGLNSGHTKKKSLHILN